MTKLLNEKEMLSLYNEGDQFLTNGKYSEAINKFQLITESSQGNSFSFISGAYTNLAHATLEHAFIKKKSDKEMDLTYEEVLSYVERALEIKPTNQSAMSIAIPVLTYKKEFSSAIAYFLKLTNKEIIDHSMAYISSIESFALNKDSSIQFAIPALEKLYTSYNYDPRVYSILANSYVSVGELQKAYNIYNESLSKFKKYPEVYMSICINFSLFCTGLLKNDKEALKITEEGMAYFKQQNSVFKKNNEYLMNSLLTNMSVALIHLQEYKSALKIIKPLLLTEPTNANLSNMAAVYLKLGDYNNALKYSEQALLITTDEISLYLKAESYYSLKNYREALHWYKKARSFCTDDETNLTFDFTDSTGEMRFSIPIDLKSGLIKVNIGMIHSYLSLREFASAKALIKMNLEQWPYEDELIKLEKQIDIFLEQEFSNSEILDTMNCLIKDAEEYKNAQGDNLSEVRTWAFELLKLQNRCTKDEKVIIENEEDWRVILNKMHHIAIEMKDSAPKKNVAYKDIHCKFQLNYPNIKSNSLEFLTTAEYLYQIHKENKIDFAPIVLEYSKVIEAELNRYLKELKFIDKKQNLTLGQIHFRLKKIKVSNLIGIEEFLDRLIYFRNGSAHSGQSTLETVEIIRTMILEDKWLKMICA